MLSRKRDEETKNSEETGISFRQSMVQIVYDMNCVSVSGLRAVHGFSIFKRQKPEFVRKYGTPPLVLKIYFRYY